MSGSGGIGRRGALGLGLGALVAACGRAGGGGGTLLAGDQKGGSKVVLEASHHLDRLPYHIEWSSFPNAAPLLEALNAGAIDTGIGGDAAFIFSIGTGAALKAIGAQKYEGPGPILVVRRDSAIHSLKDIAGKRIATPKGSIGHNFILAALEAQGRPLDAVQFAFLSPQDGNAALLGGSVDGWAIWDPNATIAEKQGARLIFEPGLVPSYALLFGSDPAIAGKRPLLADYKRRLYQGWDWAASHPDDYARLLNRETGIPVDVWQTVTARTRRLPSGIDAALIADQQKTADRYARAGLIDHHIDVKSGFDDSFS
jgi:sulfonate transport system substrate-binding protein